MCRSQFVSLVFVGLVACSLTTTSRSSWAQQTDADRERSQQVNSADERQANSADENLQRTDERLSANQRNSTRRSEDGSNQELINYLAGKLMVANQIAIEHAGTVAEQANRPAVRQFAQEVAQAHQQLNEDLHQEMPKLAKWIQNLENEERAVSTGAARDTQAPLDGAARRLMAICRHTAANYQQMVDEMMADLDGQDYDMAFLGQQVGGHVWMIAELKAIQNVGPAELREIAAHAEQLGREHLSKARKLAQRFEDDRQLN